MASDTPAGRLRHLKPVVQLSETPPRWARPSVPLGYQRPVWPARESELEVRAPPLDRSACARNVTFRTDQSWSAVKVATSVLIVAAE